VLCGSVGSRLVGRSVFDWVRDCGMRLRDGREGRKSEEGSDAPEELLRFRQPKI